jgi:hypothetical protein
LLNVLSATDGVVRNDKPFLEGFPFVAPPWSGLEGGTCDCGDNGVPDMQNIEGMHLELTPPANMSKDIEVYPNPSSKAATIRFNLVNDTDVTLAVYDVAGRLVATPIQHKLHKAGVHEVKIDVSNLDRGVYFATLQNSEGKKQTVKIVVAK